MSKKVLVNGVILEVSVPEPKGCGARFKVGDPDSTHCWTVSCGTFEMGMGMWTCKACQKEQDYVIAVYDALKREE